MRFRSQRAVVATLCLCAAVVFGLSVGSNRLAKWYRFRGVFEWLGTNEFGFSEYKHSATGIVMIEIPGGEFLMGSPSDESARDADEGPVRRVILSPFMIAKYEVTRSEWASVMGATGPAAVNMQTPMSNVTWEDCRRFCEIVGLSLPTEAQWEFACRAGTRTRYWSGDSEWDLVRVGFCGLDKLPPGKVFPSEEAMGLQPVGSKPANPFGLHDVHGNIAEWCRDSWSSEFYRSSGSSVDPYCSDLSSSRVVRGGSWSTNASVCRSAARSRWVAEDAADDIGFRPVWP